MTRRFKRVTTRFAKSQFTTIGLVLVLYLLLVLFAPYLLYHLNTVDTEVPIVRMSITLVIGAVYALVILGTLLAFLILKKAFKIKTKDYWRPCSFGLMDFFAYATVFIALGSICLYIASIINVYIPIGSSIPLGIVLNLPNEYTSSLMYGILFCLAVPLVEEMAFRGILLRALGRYGNRFAAITAALIYALMQPSLSATLPAFFLALFLINLTLRYRSVQPAIIIHMAFNIFIYSYEFIPVDYILMSTGILFFIYLLALYFLISKRCSFVKINKSKNQEMVYKLFYTRFTVILAFVLSVAYGILIF